MKNSEYLKHIEDIIKHLNGKIDLYDGKHEIAINIWNDIWDEMIFQDLKPDNASDIKKYIKENY